MGEERYVVRDRDHDMWFSASDEVDHDNLESRYSNQKRVDEVEMDRARALAVAAFCERNHPTFRPFTLFRAKSKPKPKAPREVYIVIERSGLIPNVGPYLSTPSAATFAASKGGARIVRYVLAEGE